MPKIATPSHLYYPPLESLIVTSTSISLSATTDRIGFVWKVPKTGTINGIKFATGTVTTGCTLRGCMQTVDSSGVPTTTLYHANATGTVVVADADDNVEKIVTFTAGVAVTKGDDIFVGLDVSSGTPISLGIRKCAPAVGGMPPYGWQNIATVASNTGLTLPVIAITWSTGTEVFSQYSALTSQNSTSSVSSSTTPDEIGMKFTMPYGGECDGWYFLSATSSNAQPLDVVLYDSASAVLATHTLDTASIKNIGAVNHISGLWTTPVSLLRGRTYRLVLKPTTTTTWTNLLGWVGLITVDAVGADQYGWTERTDAGAWTDTPSRRARMAVTFSGLYVPGGSFF